MKNLKLTKYIEIKKIEKRIIANEKPVTVCVDAMGGDYGPEPVLDGILQALHAKPNLSILVAGDPAIIDPLCSEYERLTALPCTEAIGMDEHPAEAVHAKKDSSIVKGCKAVNKGNADAFFSAGATGAIFTAATLNVGRAKDIKRPALAAILPGKKGHQTVFLDLGANADLRSDVYPQLAAMGSALYHTYVKVKDCRVGLLSNGTEDTKGSEHTLQAFAELKNTQKGSGFTFVGNVEGNDLLLGDYDVVVASGLLGNVALKCMEGAVKYAVYFLKQNAAKAPWRALGLLLCSHRFKKMGYDLSGEAYGGAFLLGLRNPVVIGHGKTSAKAVKNGIIAAAEMVEKGLCKSVEKELSTKQTAEEQR